MKNKHLHIESHSKLLAHIRRSIQNELVINKAQFNFLLRVKLLFYLGLSIIFYLTLFTSISAGAFIISYVMLGLSLLLLAFNFAHDFSHNTVFSKKSWNNLGFIGIFTLLGAHAEAWRERHVKSHHFAPNVKEYDSDLQITDLIRVSPDMPYRWFHRFQHIYALLAYSTYSLYWIFIKDIKLLQEKLKFGDLHPQYLFSFLGQKIFYLAYILILPLMYSHQSLQTVLIGFFLMHMIKSIFLLITFFMTHHVMETTYPETNEAGIIQTSWLMNQISSSNDMHPFSKFANFILGGFNNHIAHHLFPHIHHIHYPELSKILYRILKKNNVTPNETSYLGGAISHFKLLATLSKGNTQFGSVSH